jgi:hypothetical protein
VGGLKDPKIQKHLSSHKFQILIVVLVIIDCLCVAGELIIESIENTADEKIAMSKTNPRVFHSNSTNLTDTDTHQSLHHHSESFHHLHPVLVGLEGLLKYASFAILSFFVFLRLVFIPRVFLRPLEILDTV